MSLSPRSVLPICGRGVHQVKKGPIHLSCTAGGAGAGQVGFLEEGALQGHLESSQEAHPRGAGVSKGKGGESGLITGPRKKLETGMLPGARAARTAPWVLPRHTQRCS